jgi:hypothetical protein
MTPLQRLIAAAEEALEFIDGYVDVIDGPDGEPMPNRAMQIVAELEN